MRKLAGYFKIGDKDSIYPGNKTEDEEQDADDEYRDQCVSSS